MLAPVTIILDVLAPQHLRDVLQAPPCWSELPSNTIFDIQDVSAADAPPPTGTDSPREAPQ